MIKVELSDKQVQRALNNISKYSQEVQKGTQKEIAKAAIQIESKAKEIVPRQTSVLATSIIAEIEPGRATVGTNVKYAPFVEFGTRYWSGKPFLYPAWNIIRPKFLNAIRALLKK